MSNNNNQLIKPIVDKADRSNSKAGKSSEKTGVAGAWAGSAGVKTGGASVKTGGAAKKSSNDLSADADSNTAADASKKSSVKK